MNSIRKRMRAHGPGAVIGVIALVAASREQPWRPRT